MKIEYPDFKVGDKVSIENTGFEGVIIGRKGMMYSVKPTKHHKLNMLDHGNMVFHLEPEPEIATIDAHIGLLSLVND